MGEGEGSAPPLPLPGAFSHKKPGWQKGREVKLVQGHTAVTVASGSEAFGLQP